MPEITYRDFLVYGWPANESDRDIIERWRSSGRSGYPSTQTLNHIRWRLMFESDRYPSVQAATNEWFVDVPPSLDADPAPSPAPTTHDTQAPPRLVTHMGSPYLHRADTGSPYDYREATAMSIYRQFLDGRRDEVHALFSYFAANGINAIRPLFNLASHYWLSRGLGNSHLEGDRFWGQLHPFCHMASNYGLSVRCCLLGGVEAFIGHQLVGRPDAISGNPAAREKIMAYVDQFVGTVRSFPERNVLIELANEPSQIGLGYSSTFLANEVLPHVVEMAPNMVVNIGAACDENNTDYCVDPASLFDEHLRRMPEADYLMSVKRLIEHTSVDYAMGKMPMISGEWMNLGDVEKHDEAGTADGTPSTATAFATAVMCRLKGVIPSFHNHGLLWGTVPNEITHAAVEAWQRGLDLLPVDVYSSGSRCNGHWPQSPFHNQKETIFPQTEESTPSHQGPVRIYGIVQDGGHFVGLSLREPAGYHLEGDRPIETLHLERWGDWQCRLVRTT